MKKKVILIGNRVSGDLDPRRMKSISNGVWYEEVNSLTGERISFTLGLLSYFILYPRRSRYSVRRDFTLLTESEPDRFYNFSVGLISSSEMDQKLPYQMGVIVDEVTCWLHFIRRQYKSPELICDGLLSVQPTEEAGASLEFWERCSNDEEELDSPILLISPQNRVKDDDSSTSTYCSSLNELTLTEDDLPASSDTFLPFAKRLVAASNSKPPIQR